MSEDLEFMTYEQYKNFLASTGSSMYEYSADFEGLFELLHNVPEIEFESDFEKDDLQKSIYKLTFFHIAQLNPTDKKKMLLRLKNSIKKLHNVVDKVLDIEIKACENVESSEDRFINQFNDTDQLDKKTAALYCRRGETWIHGWKNKDAFDEDINGVYLKSFLKWLSVEKHKEFLEFKKNWRSKHLKS
jgi:hypothetical protein